MRPALLNRRCQCGEVQSVSCSSSRLRSRSGSGSGLVLARRTFERKDGKSSWTDHQPGDLGLYWCTYVGQRWKWWQASVNASVHKRGVHAMLIFTCSGLNAGHHCLMQIKWFSRLGPHTALAIKIGIISFATIGKSCALTFKLEANHSLQPHESVVISWMGRHCGGGRKDAVFQSDTKCYHHSQSVKKKSFWLDKLGEESDVASRHQ